MITVDMDTYAFREAVRRARANLKVNISELIREESRLFVGEFRRRVPPFETYGKTVKKEHRMIGEKAVTGDLRRVARPLDPTKIQVPRIRDAVVAQDVASLQAMADNSATDWLAKRRIIESQQLATVHPASRNRLGRVRTDMRRATFQDAGRESYLKKITDNVGKAKATFNAAAFALGLATAQWIKRHGSRGSFTQDADGTATLIGRAFWPRSQEVVREVITLRGKKLTSEINRIVTTFHRTGKIATRRKSFNMPAEG